MHGGMALRTQEHRVGRDLSADASVGTVVANMSLGRTTHVAAAAIATVGRRFDALPMTRSKVIGIPRVPDQSRTVIKLVMHRHTRPRTPDKKGKQGENDAKDQMRMRRT